MQPHRNNILKQPALIPIAGNFDRKPRPLDRDVTTIGRARGTDLCLEAHEISTLHCVVFRAGEGYRIRDCNSRCGTRVNGESVKNGALRDGDIVNLGPFSFEFRLPPSLFPDSGRLDPLKIEHWKESRQRLGVLALKLRRRLRDPNLSSREQEWKQKAHLLKEKIRSYDQRFGELEAAEEELNQERKQLAAEGEKHHQRVQAIEQELAQRFADLERETHERWREFQQRCRAEEARVAGQSPPERVANTKDTLHDGAAQRQEEANARIKHLQELDEHLNRRHDQWQREQQEFTAMKDQWVKDQAKTSATLDEQHATLAQQRADLLRMMGDLKKMQEDLRRQAKADVGALTEELEQLRRENADLRERLQAGPAASADDDTQRQIDELRAEVNLLNDELQAREQTLEEIQKSSSANFHGAVKAENHLLKKLLEEKEKLIAEQAHKSTLAPKSENDLERYEAELNEFRRQLETDRVKLNDEVETLRDRNKELDEAIREMEMEMSKERADLARERMRLERVREEVKSDMERLQREQAVRDSMAPVQKLRDELNQKQPGGKSINDRLRASRTPGDPQAAST